ncbi:thiamine pyrophosphate-requiring protein [Geodermatophilus sp. DF01-2]|uniref:thiamine pyrophosphate-requiring protein n=1 Tax=Geodermatophilus sp. DF01-2 TaxID=2559610 RepID=UPI00143211D1|nr:thiamine pyrophosphate-requiring protein [Geodermatophilus sp. DF01_2]
MSLHHPDVDARPRPDEVVEALDGAESLLRLLSAQGVERIFLNPGTDTAPIQEAAVALRGRGIEVPTIQLCPDERVALAAAQGFWLRTRRPQVVIVHVDVGTQSLGAMLHNAQRANSGVVIMAGTAPRTLEGDLPGGRTIAVHWQQDQPDQIGIVRGYVKWAEELTMPETLVNLVPRAFQVARSEPAGPVYMTVAREVLMRPTEGVRVIPPERQRPPVLPAACRDAIATAARWIAEAERPLVITGRVGRQRSSAEAMARLVETAGLPLADTREFVNLPSGHACYLEDDAVAADTLRSADLVLLVDVEVPWVPLNRRPPEDARVIQIDLDPVKASMVNYGFRVDLPIQADSGQALWQLLKAVEAERTDERSARWQRRADELAAASRERARVRAELVAQERATRPVSAVALVDALNAVLDPEAVVMEEVTTNDVLVREHLRRERPDTIHAISAAGLGWALGAAMGAKLAEPARDVVALCGDGTFVFSSPVAALWAARDAGAPFLTVILNNQGYRAAKFPVVTLFPDGASVGRQDFTGVVIADPPDYAAVARACGAHGERVEDPDRLVDALTEALKAVRSGRCGVVDVILDGI